MILCFVNDENKWNGQMCVISTQCRWIGLIYITLAWFMGDGTIVASGRDTYMQIAHWMQIFSIGWIVVFVVTLFFRLFNQNDKMSNKALGSALIYFIVAYLIH